jgi:hypothetical protein
VRARGFYEGLKIVERTLSGMEGTSAVQTELDIDALDAVLEVKEHESEPETAETGTEPGNQDQDSKMSLTMPTDNDITRLLNTMNAHLPEPVKDRAFLVVMGLSAGRTVDDEHTTEAQNALWHALPPRHETHEVLYRLWRCNYVSQMLAARPGIRASAGGTGGRPAGRASAI